MRLLVVEDMPELLKPLVLGLKRSGYDVDQAHDGKVGLWMAEGKPYDVVVLDIMLPGMDGLTLLRRIREKGMATRVLLLTAKDAVEDRVAGLRAGADDYLVKPFAFDELLARIEALLRRGRETRAAVLQCGPLRIDTAAKHALRGRSALPLTPREFAILEYLALNRGRVVSRTEIEQNIYDELAEPVSNVVDSAICALRRKIDEHGDSSLIQTRRGQGYIILAEDQ